MNIYINPIIPLWSYRDFYLHFAILCTLCFMHLSKLFSNGLKNPHSHSLLMRGKIVTLCIIFLYLIYAKHRKLKKFFRLTVKNTDFFLIGRGSKFQNMCSMKNILKCNFENMQSYKVFSLGYKIPLRLTLIYESCNLH